MARFIRAAPLILTLVLLAGASSTVLAQSPGCGAGVAVSDPANNPGLVADCDALLAARDTLAGSATLNWSADLAIRREGGPLITARYQLVSNRRPVDRDDTGGLGQLVQPSFSGPP